MGEREWTLAVGPSGYDGVEFALYAQGPQQVAAEEEELGGPIVVVPKTRAEGAERRVAELKEALTILVTLKNLRDTDPQHEYQRKLAKEAAWESARAKEPITRLAARLWDAEGEGYSFECLGRRDKCKIWRLCGEPDVEGSDGGSGGGVRSIPSSSDRIPVAALDAGVEGDGGADGRQTLTREHGAAIALNPGRLFEVKPERTHHYDLDEAA